DFALDSARQVDVPGEHVTWVDVARPAVAIALGPAQIVTRMMAMPIRLRLPRVVSRSAAELPRIVVAVARLGLPPVVTAIERITRLGRTAIATRFDVLLVSRIGVARVEIHGNTR